MLQKFVPCYIHVTRNCFNQSSNVMPGACGLSPAFLCLFRHPPIPIRHPALFRHAEQVGNLCCTQSSSLQTDIEIPHSKPCLSTDPHKGSKTLQTTMLHHGTSMMQSQNLLFQCWCHWFMRILTNAVLSAGVFWRLSISHVAEHRFSS